MTRERASLIGDNPRLAAPKELIVPLAIPISRRRAFSGGSVVAEPQEVDGLPRLGIAEFRRPRSRAADAAENSGTFAGRGALNFVIGDDVHLARLLPRSRVHAHRGRWAWAGNRSERAARFLAANRSSRLGHAFLERTQNVARGLEIVADEAVTGVDADPLTRVAEGFEGGLLAFVDQMRYGHWCNLLAAVSRHPREGRPFLRAE